MDEQKLFETAHDALVFAYGFNAQNYDRPLINRMADGYVPTGKGLAGLDGAAQAGIIRAEVKTLGAVKEAIVTAYFAPKTLPCSCGHACCCGNRQNDEWAAAIDVIAKSALKRNGVQNYALTRALVMRAFRVPCQITQIADLCGVHRNTASEYWSYLSQWLNGRRKKTVGEIETAIMVAGDKLVECGVV